MPVTSNSRNYRFNPHTEVSYPATVSGEVCLPYYFTEFDDYGFITEETPRLTSPSTFSVTRSGSAQTFSEVAHGIAPAVGQYSVDYDAVDQYAMGFVRLNQTDCSGTFLVNYQGLGRSLRDNPLIWSGVPALDARVTIVSGQIQSTINTQLKAFHYNWHMSNAIAGEFNDVVYGSGQFVAVGDQPTYRVMTSNTGVYWTGRSSVAGNTLTGVAYSPTLSGGMYAACSNDGSQRIQTSLDGQSWTPITVSLGTFNAIAHGADTFVSVMSGFCLRSTNGQTWSIAATPHNANWIDVAYSPTLGRFAAVANSIGSGTTWVMTSDNSGTTWAERTAIAKPWISICWSSDLGKFVAGSDAGQIMSSADGITWATVTPDVTINNIQKVTAGNGLVIFTRASNNMFATSDLTTFKTIYTPSYMILNGIAYGAGRFVAVGESNFSAAYSDMIEY